MRVGKYFPGRIRRAIIDGVHGVYILLPGHAYHARWCTMTRENLLARHGMGWLLFGLFRARADRTLSFLIVFLNPTPSSPFHEVLILKCELPPGSWSSAARLLEKVGTRTALSKAHEHTGG